MTRDMILSNKEVEIVGLLVVREILAQQGAEVDDYRRDLWRLAVRLDKAHGHFFDGREAGTWLPPYVREILHQTYAPDVKARKKVHPKVGARGGSARIAAPTPTSEETPHPSAETAAAPRSPSRRRRREPLETLPPETPEQ